jgi:hypothetical protein
MREVYKEYDFDWRLGSCARYGLGLANATPREYQYSLGYAPSYRDALDEIIRSGDPGVLMVTFIRDYIESIVQAHSQGKKVALVTFNFSPAILHAFDIVPFCLEAMTTFYTAVWKQGISDSLDFCCEKGFTETSCSGQRVGLGPVLAGLGVKPDMILYSTAGVCDSNAAAYAFASSYLDIPQHNMNYPPTLTDERATEYHRADFRSMVAFLEEQTGKKMDMDKLREVAAEIVIQDQLFNELQDLQRVVPCPMHPLYAMMNFAFRMIYLGSKQYTMLMKSILKATKENAAKGLAGVGGKERVRAFFFYIDHFCPNIKWVIWNRKQGISNVGAFLNDFWPKGSPFVKNDEEAYEMDLSSYDSIIDSLAAQTSRFPMVKNIRGPYDAPMMWLDDTLSMARIIKPDVLFYIGTMGCRNTWSNVKLMVRDLEKAGYPTFVSYGDSFDNRVDPIDNLIGKCSEFLKVRGILQ